MNIGIYVYHGAEVLDFAGPYEVFTTATRVKAGRDSAAAPIFNVFLIAQGINPVQARANFTVQPHYSFEDHPFVDVLIIPGGIHTNELENLELMRWLGALSHETRITASVCTGAFLLARAGILQNQSCTTHWEDIPDLQAMFPSLAVQEEVSWVDNGHIITSAGISAGIEMSLHLVARLAGKDLAIKTARQMQYRWNSESSSLEST